MLNQAGREADGAAAPAPGRRGGAGRVAMLLSCDSFEKFFGGTFGLDRDAYVGSYRNDFAWDYAEGLRQRGHDVFLYVLSYGPPELRRTPEGLHVRFVRLAPWLRLVDPLLFRLRGTGLGRARDRVALAAFGRSLLSALSEDRIGVLYVQEIWTARFELLLRRVPIPVIGADHGAPDDPRLDGRRRDTFPRAAALVCQSAGHLARVQALGGRGVLIANGTDTRFFTPPAAGARPRTVLAVGRLAETQKRFGDLLRAMALLPDYTLVLAGRGPDGDALQALASRLGVAGRVRFAGFVSDRAELRRLYRDCGVFVSSSAWEAMALVLLEAMSCAAPVVATRIATFEALISDGVNGRLVPVGSPEALAAAIADAHARGAELGAAGRRTVEAQYGSEAVHDRVGALVAEAAGTAAALA